MSVIAVPTPRATALPGTQPRGERPSPAPYVLYSEMAGAGDGRRGPKTLRHQKRPPIQPPRCSDEKISKQSRRQHSGCAVSGIGSLHWNSYRSGPVAACEVNETAPAVQDSSLEMCYEN